MTVSQLYGITKKGCSCWFISFEVTHHFNANMHAYCRVQQKCASVYMSLSFYLWCHPSCKSCTSCHIIRGVRCHVPALQVWHLQVRTPHNWSELSLPLLCLYLTLVSAALLSTPEEGYVIKCKHKKSEILQHILAKKKEKERPQLVNVLCPFLLALFQEKK